MKLKNIILCSSLILLSAASFSYSQENEVKENPVSENKKSETVENETEKVTVPMIDYIQKVSDNTEINWTKKTIKVTGTGVLPSKGNIAQKIRASKRSAMAKGYKYIQQAIEEFHINSEIIAKDFLYEKSTKKQILSKIIYNVKINELNQTEDGHYPVEMEMKIFGKNGIADFFDYETEKNTSKQTKLKGDSSSESYSGIIIDCKNLNFTPSLIPSIMDSDNGFIYPIEPVSTDNISEDGIAEFTDNITEAKKSKKSGENPLVIRAVKVTGTYKSSIILKNEDAKKIIGSKLLSNNKIVIII